MCIPQISESLTLLPYVLPLPTGHNEWSEGYRAERRYRAKPARQPGKEHSSDEGCGRSPSEALPVTRPKFNEPLTVLKAKFSRLGQTLAFCGKCAIFCEGAFPAHKI